MSTPLSANLALLGKVGLKKSSPFLALTAAVMSFSMYIVAFVIDNKCVKNKGNEKTYRAMKWVLALGLTALITMFLTILLASTGKGKMEIDPRLAFAAGIVTFICTIIGSGYGIWASLKCEDKLKKTRLGLHITSIVFALLSVMLAYSKSDKTYGRQAINTASKYTGRQSAAFKAAVAARAQAVRAAAQPAAPAMRLNDF